MSTRCQAKNEAETGHTVGKDKEDWAEDDDRRLKTGRRLRERAVCGYESVCKTKQKQNVTGNNHIKGKCNDEKASKATLELQAFETESAFECCGIVRRAAHAAEDAVTVRTGLQTRICAAQAIAVTAVRLTRDRRIRGCG